MIKLIAGDFTLDAAKGDAPRRTISGTAECPAYEEVTLVSLTYRACVGLLIFT